MVRLLGGSGISEELFARTGNIVQHHCRRFEQLVPGSSAPVEQQQLIGTHRSFSDPGFNGWPFISRKRRWDLK